MHFNLNDSLQSFFEKLQKGEVSKDTLHDLELGVNSFGIPKQELTTLILGDEKATKTFLQVITIAFLAFDQAFTKQQYYDDRNEASVKYAHDLVEHGIMQVLPVEQLVESCRDREIENLKIYFLHIHRTLQQNIMRLIVTFLENYKGTKTFITSRPSLPFI